MDKTTTIIAGVVLVAVIAGIFFYSTQNPSAPSGAATTTVTNSTAQSPIVLTRTATEVSTSSAIVHASVNPNGASTNYWFEYSTSAFSSLAALSTTAQVNVGSNTLEGVVDMKINLLSPKMTYYFRVVAQNSQGVVRGDTMTFMTK